MESVPKPAGTFRYTEETKDGTPGRTFEFTSVNIEPLDYAALARAKLHRKVSIPITWKDVTIVHASVNEIDQNLKYSVTAQSLNADFTANAISLIKGGWLPSALAASDLNTIVMVDRNIVTQIRKRFDQGKPKYLERDFIDLFADQPIRINPMLFGMEGNTKEIPTPEQVRAQIEKAVGILKAALPSAEIMADAAHIRGALGLIEDSRLGFEKKQLFLMRLAPILAAPVSGKDRRKRWNEVLAVADEYGIPRNSLVVLAALSSVIVPNGRSPTKGLLNFKPKYSKEDAYNALCDIRSLEILMCGFAMYPAQPMQLCTADRKLALFWTGIGASNFDYSNNEITYDLHPREELFPQPFLKELYAILGSRLIDEHRRHDPVTDLPHEASLPKQTPRAATFQPHSSGVIGLAPPNSADRLADTPEVHDFYDEVREKIDDLRSLGSNMLGPQLDRTMERFAARLPETMSEALERLVWSSGNKLRSILAEHDAVVGDRDPHPAKLDRAAAERLRDVVDTFNQLAVSDPALRQRDADRPGPQEHDRSRSELSIIIGVAAKAAADRAITTEAAGNELADNIEIAKDTGSRVVDRIALELTRDTHRNFFAEAITYIYRALHRLPNFAQGKGEFISKEYFSGIYKAAGAATFTGLAASAIITYETRWEIVSFVLSNADQLKLYAAYAFEQSPGFKQMIDWLEAHVRDETTEND